mgnify:CR=1 FL=1
MNAIIWLHKLYENVNHSIKQIIRRSVSQSEMSCLHISSCSHETSAKLILLSQVNKFDRQGRMHNIPLSVLILSLFLFLCNVHCTCSCLCPCKCFCPFLNSTNLIDKDEFTTFLYLSILLSRSYLCTCSSTMYMFL